MRPNFLPANCRPLHFPAHVPIDRCTIDSKLTSESGLLFATREASGQLRGPLSCENPFAALVSTGQFRQRNSLILMLADQLAFKLRVMHSTA